MSTIEFPSDNLPGYIDLLESDKQYLINLLKSNSGSRDSIKKSRVWILERNFSAYAISNIIREYILTISQIPNSNSKLLITVYILNDIFYYVSEANNKCMHNQVNEQLDLNKTEFINCIWPNLLHIMWICYKSFLSDQTNLDKLIRMSDLWFAKNLIDLQLKQIFFDSMKAGTEPNYPIYKSLAKPLQPSMKDENHPNQAFNAPHPYPHPPPPPSPHQIQQNLSMQSHPGNFINSSIGYPPNQNFQNPYPQYGGPLQGFQNLSVPSPQIFLPQQYPTNFPQHSLPVMASLAVDLQKTTVGTLANLVKQSLKAKKEKYTPLDPSNLATLVQPVVEAGRLEVRMNDFYKKYNELKDSQISSDKKFARF